MKSNLKSGLIKVLLIIFVAVAILAYLQADIRQVVNSIWQNHDFGPLWDLVKQIWTDIIVPSAKNIKDWVLKTVKS